MSRKKRTASLYLDLDNQWTYMKTHGDAGWEEFPTYLPVVIPRFLDDIGPVLSQSFNSRK